MSPAVYGYLADLMVVLHVAIIAYVLLGQLVIVFAAPLRWQPARNPWFRLTHLLVIAIVVWEQVNDIRCPLSVWEEQFRLLAGQATAAEATFMGRIMHQVLFYDDIPQNSPFFMVLYVSMFLIVMQGIVMYPPRMFRFRRRPTAVPEPQPAAA